MALTPCFPGTSFHIKFTSAFRITWIYWLSSKCVPKLLLLFNHILCDNYLYRDISRVCILKPNITNFLNLACRCFLVFFYFRIINIFIEYVYWIKQTTPLSQRYMVYTDSIIHSARQHFRRPLPPHQYICLLSYPLLLDPPPPSSLLTPTCQRDGWPRIRTEAAASNRLIGRVSEPSLL